MELPDRIAAIIKVNQHSAATFADAIGVQRSSISHILNGRNKPSLDVLEKILNHFPRVDATWLITGKEPAKERAIGSVTKTEVRSNDSNKVEGSLPSTAKLNSPGEGKTIDRIVVFYTDRTFDTYAPN